MDREREIRVRVSTLDDPPRCIRPASTLRSATAPRPCAEMTVAPLMWSSTAAVQPGPRLRARACAIWRPRPRHADPLSQHGDLELPFSSGRGSTRRRPITSCGSTVPRWQSRPPSRARRRAESDILTEDGAPEWAPRRPFDWQSASVSTTSYYLATPRGYRSRRACAAFTEWLQSAIPAAEPTMTPTPEPGRTGDPDVSAQTPKQFSPP